MDQLRDVSNFVPIGYSYKDQSEKPVSDLTLHDQ